MKIKKTFNMLAAVCLGALLLTGLTGCGVPKNKVFSTDDLPGKTIGVQSGTTGQSYALELEKSPAEGKPAAKVIDYKMGSDAIEALIKGELDCVIIDNEPAKHFILQNDTLQILPDIFVNEYYAIAVNKSENALTAELNIAMNELINDGTVEKILANYIGDSAGSFQYKSPENVNRKPSASQPVSADTEKRVAKDDAQMQTNNPAMPTRVLENGTRINLHFGDTVLPGILNDCDTAKALIEMLPYTVHMNSYSHDFCGVMPDSLPYNEDEVHYGWLNGDIDYAIDAPYFTILHSDEDISERYGYQVNIGVLDCELSQIRELTGSYDVLIELAD